MRKVYMVTDLGPGDGGKGGVVHKLSHMRRAHTIVKVGGAQGSHGVRTAAGQSFAFSQFGCGTFEGVKTHLSPRFIADPVGIINEANALHYEYGVHDPCNLLTIDQDVLCNTPLHGIASRIKELALRNNPRGTVGTGVGQTYRLHQVHPELSIFVRDLSSPKIREKLLALRDHFLVELEPLVSDGVLTADKDLLAEDVALLHDCGFIDYLVEQFQIVPKVCKIVDADYFAKDILERDGVIIVESSHGILTDCYTGFHPHTSAIRTLPRFTRALFEQAGYDGEIVSLGIHRAYSIRHGAGPLPTHSEIMSESLLPGSNKDDNRWQGSVRVGPLDLVLLRYALAASGENAYDGLAITWFDQIERNGDWNLCHRYGNATNQQYFTEDGNIRLRVGDDSEQLSHLSELTKRLQVVTPEITSVSLPSDASQDQLYGLVAEHLREQLNVPVRMISFGPTERDKVCK